MEIRKKLNEYFNKSMNKSYKKTNILKIIL